MKRFECFNHFKYEIGPSFESEDVDMSELDDEEPELDDYLKEVLYAYHNPREASLSVGEEYIPNTPTTEIIAPDTPRQKRKSPTLHISVDREICLAVEESGQEMMIRLHPLILHLLVLFGLCLRLTSMSRMSRLANLMCVMICSSYCALGFSAILVIPDKKLLLLFISFCQNI
ncbi:hypothetical protein SOVF_208300 [Spinacia oleracea]|nr:hypothetical protein SOVF_208300 [Spinacia oleracea]